MVAISQQQSVAIETETIVCPLCESAPTSTVTRIGPVRIARCKICGLVYSNPRPRNSNTHYHGEKAGLIKKYGAVFDGTQPHNRDDNYREHLAKIRAYKPTGNFLDVGTHCGFFLRMARNQGWTLQGVEPASNQAELAQEKFGLDVKPGYLQEGMYDPHSFDVITLTDVLEHVTVPQEVLGTVHHFAKPDGIVFIKVPNVRWTLFKHRILGQLLKRKEFDIWDAREHVVHYTQETLTAMLAQTGWDVVKFYVPKPIQTGAKWRRAIRTTTYNLARGLQLVTGKLTAFSPDLAVIARPTRT